MTELHCTLTKITQCITVSQRGISAPKTLEKRRSFILKLTHTVGIYYNAVVVIERLSNRSNLAVPGSEIGLFLEVLISAYELVLAFSMHLARRSNRLQSI